MGEVFNLFWFGVVQKEEHEARVEEKNEAVRKGGGETKLRQVESSFGIQQKIKTGGGGNGRISSDTRGGEPEGKGFFMRKVTEWNGEGKTMNSDEVEEIHHSCAVPPLATSYMGVGIKKREVEICLQNKEGFSAGQPLRKWVRIMWGVSRKKTGFLVRWIHV